MRTSSLPRTVFQLTLGALACTSFASAPIVVKLWPEGAPERPGFVGEPEKRIEPHGNNDVLRLTHVTDPTLSVYQPEKPNGTGIIVCPGGGYSILAIEHEGTRVCEWLNSIGVTAVLLKYRVPVRMNQPGFEPLQDLQRAVGIVRHRAEEWGIHPQKVGVLGFSAGGHLTVMGGLHANERTYRTDPQYDVEDATPNFIIPIYPAYLLSKEDSNTLVPTARVVSKAPPIFLVHANDDRGATSSAGSALLYLEYKRLGLPAELHVFSTGGHGFGMRKGSNPANEWPRRLEDWLRVSGLLEHSAKRQEAAK